jgi:hypothetical protein
MDTNRLMSAYSISGSANSPNALEGCFQLTSMNTVHSAKGPYKSTDENHALHQRLAIDNRHFIPIGFYYSKWLEKLRFHLGSRGED